MDLFELFYRMRFKYYNLKISILAFILVSFSWNVHAQIESATLGINGLTCSLCSYNVERELIKVEGIDSVQMNLNANIAKIIFNKSIPIQMLEVINAVYKAGFSVGYTQAIFSTDIIKVDNDNCFFYQGNYYQILNATTQSLEGTVIFKFVDKKFVTPKEYKRWEKLIKAGKVCSSKSSAVYHIIL